MAQISIARLNRRGRRRAGGALFAILCLWLLAFAIHVHAPGEDMHAGTETAYVCGFCASLAVGAGAADMPRMAAPAGRSLRLNPPPDARDPGSIRLASYRSRAPPAA
jgi:hypothetical protein